MILQKTFKKIIPSYRHKQDVIIKDYITYTKKPKKKRFNNTLMKKKKQFYRFSSFSTSNVFYRYVNLITVKALYNKKPYKKFFLCKTWYNFFKIIPSVEFLNVGKTIYSFFFSKKNPYKLYSRGSNVELFFIPITCYVNNVTNKDNSKISYAKSSGAFCKIQKSKKSKSKLVLLVLPSKKIIYLPKNCTGFIGKSVNFKNNKIVEGSWGSSLHKSKHINVRGVAMNPVDHPNGGRAKTVQPERSPWNWVAKKKK